MTSPYDLGGVKYDPWATQGIWTISNYSSTSLIRSSHSENRFFLSKDGGIS